MLTVPSPVLSSTGRSCCRRTRTVLAPPSVELKPRSTTSCHRYNTTSVATTSPASHARLAPQLPRDACCTARAAIPGGSHCR